jgi:hypothetical protein
MEGMRPAAFRAVLVVLAACPLLAACGGASAESAPASDPTSATEAPATDAPAAADAKPANATDTPAKEEPTATEDEKALGEGDTRTMESIAALVKTHRKEARACYEDGRKQNASLTGDLVVHFILKPSGEVKHAELNKERSTITEPSVVKCVISVVTAIQFPKSSKGLESTVNYPFNFTP